MKMQTSKPSGSVLADQCFDSTPEIQNLSGPSNPAFPEHQLISKDLREERFLSKVHPSTALLNQEHQEAGFHVTINLSPNPLIGKKNKEPETIKMLTTHISTQKSDTISEMNKKDTLPFGSQNLSIKNLKLNRDMGTLLAQDQPLIKAKDHLLEAQRHINLNKQRN